MLLIAKHSELMLLIVKHSELMLLIAESLSQQI